MKTTWFPARSRLGQRTSNSENEVTFFVVFAARS